MRSYELFKQYIWLVGTISRAGKISLEEINRRWLGTELSGGIEIARTTFIRHKAAIQDIFGIEIECDTRNGFSYYIANQEVLQENSIQNWMLSTITVSNLLGDSRSVHDRILLESIPSNGDNIRLFIEAMKTSRRITVTYRKYGFTEPSEHTVEPYCIKLFQRRWYALVRHITRDSLFTLSFDRIIDIRLTEEHFKIDKDFDAQSWFSDSYGVFRNQDADLERVVIRAYGREAFYLRDLPFHHSQREIASGEDWTDFEYWLRISNDFYTPLLSRGPNIKVLQPQWLADEIRQQLLKAAGLYEGAEGISE